METYEEVMNRIKFEETLNWYEENYPEYFEEEDWDEADTFTEKNRNRAVRIRKANEDRLRRVWKKAQIARAKAKETKRTKRELRLRRYRFDATC